MSLLLLLGTSGCHLCEQAEEIILQSRIIHPHWVVELIDIAEQSEWQEKYAIRIPVLYHPDSQSDIGWPFDIVQLQAFIEKIGYNSNNN